MAKVRIHALAKELGIQSKDVIGFLAERNIEVKSVQSSVEGDVIEMVKQRFTKSGAATGNGESKTEAKAALKPEEKAEAKTKAKTERKIEEKDHKAFTYVCPLIPSSATFDGTMVLANAGKRYLKF